MRRLLLRLWREETGTVLGPEWALVTTVLVLGAITCVIAAHRTTLLDADDPPPAQVR